MRTLQNSLSYAALGLLACLSLADTALAQNNTLVVNQPSLTFNTQVSGSAASQTLSVSSTNGTVNFTAAAFSAGNWLSVVPVTGATPADLLVSVNPSGLAAGTYSGFITLTASGISNSPLIVPVTLNVSAGAGLVSSPASLSFNYQSGTSTLPATQPVQITSTGGPISFTTSTSATFITVSPAGGTTPATLNIGVNPLTLTPGSYNGTVTLTPSTGAPIAIPVNLAVTGTPTFSVTPSQLSFAFQVGQVAPVAQNINIGSTSSAIPFNIVTSVQAGAPNFLVVNPLSGASPATVSVQINTTNLQAGTYTGQISITSPIAPTVNVPVTVLASTQPLLTVGTLPTTFNFQSGGAAPAAQTVQLGSSSTALPFTVTTAAGTPGGPIFIQSNATTGTTPQTLSLTANPVVLSTLAPGTYTNTVTVASTIAGNPAQTFTVTLNVTNNAMLNSSQNAVNFNFQTGQAAPTPQTINLTSTGAPLPVTATAQTTSCGNILSVTPSSTITPGSIVVSANTSGLAAGTCTGSITVTAPGAGNSPIIYPVTINVSATPLLNVSPAVLTVTAPVGSTNLIQQVISVTSTDPNTAIPFTATGTTTPPSGFLLVGTSGSTPLNLTVAVNPTGLPVGTYNGTITITPTNGTIPAQTIPVVLVITPNNNFASTPAAVSLNLPFGSTGTTSQTVQIATNTPGSTFSASTFTYNGGQNFLTVTPTNGVTPGTLTITANATGLAQGTYTGVVTVVIPGAANSPLYIPVTLTVGAAQALSLGASNLTFNSQAGSSPTAAQTVQVTSTGGAVPFTATVPTGSFLTVTGNGTTPGNLTITANPTGLAPGTYTSTVTIASASIPGGSKTVNVTFVVAPTPPPMVTSVVNAASYIPGAVSPGEIVTIFGAFNVTGQGVAFTAPAPGSLIANTLNNVQVTFDGIAAPLLFVSASQINAIVPYEIAGRVTVNVQVLSGNQTSTNLQLRVTDTAPAIFSQNQTGAGPGAILNQNGSLNTPTNPATRGSVVAIYATGEGFLTPSARTGGVTGNSNFPAPVGAVSVTIDGAPATVTFAGEAPGFTQGLIQINVQVPTSISANPAAAVVVTIGNNNSTASKITMAVQ